MNTNNMLMNGHFLNSTNVYVKWDIHSNILLPSHRSQRRGREELGRKQTYVWALHLTEWHSYMWEVADAHCGWPWPSFIFSELPSLEILQTSINHKHSNKLGDHSSKKLWFWAYLLQHHCWHNIRTMSAGQRGIPKQHYLPTYTMYVRSARRTWISSAPLTETGLS